MKTRSLMQLGSSAIENATPERAANLRIRPTARRQLDALSRDYMHRFLARRLRFSSRMIALTLTLLLLLKALAGVWPSVWMGIAGVLLVFCWSLTRWLFKSRREHTERGLRLTEALVFGCSFATLASLTLADLETTSQTGRFYDYVLTIRESILISLVLVAIYGVIIPNSSRRSLLIASALAAVPMATVAASLVLHTSAFPEFSGALRMQFAVESVMPLVVAICCAAVGAGLSERIRDRSINIEELGAYILKAPLGSGGMGDVYLAEHRLLKRLCAVKLIHPDKAGDSQVRARFEQEVKATAALTHPNTVQVYDYGTSMDGRFFYAMEFLEGLNLDQYVKQFGRMPAERVVYVLKQICGALHEAWCEGLVHRDIKPSNIFLSERGHMFDVAKLLDFGLVQAAFSQRVDVRRVQTKIQGSPAFMCPEQASGLEPDCRGDIYSLGAVAWFMLTGHPPFQDENPVMLVVAHATASVPNFSTTGVSVPKELESVIVKCLAKKPEERFGNPRDLLIALEKCALNKEWNWKDAEEWWLSSVPAYDDKTDSSYQRSSDCRNHEQSLKQTSDPLEETLIVDPDVVAAALPVG
ncbi:MAG: serine/threonine protein kinase [Fuerstiella sp.]|nr:serine/threonine protein kinase [Fuerstiella sp.]